MKKTFLYILALSAAFGANAQTSSTFEMRYLTKDAKADGVTDFHGQTEWLDTPQRVSVLSDYADFAARFWGDSGLNTPMFTDAQVAERTAAIKPQPSTSVRNTMDLKQWKSYGWKKGKKKDWSIWTTDGAVVSGGALVLDGKSVSCKTDTIDWRFRMKISAVASEDMMIEMNGSGDRKVPMRIDKKRLSGDTSREFEIYGDLAYDILFLSQNGKTVMEIPYKDSVVTGVTISCPAGKAVIDNMSLYSFRRTEETPRLPFHTVFHFDEDFEDIPSMDGWQTASYDDSDWEDVSLPSPHGGLKAEGESYYLRTKVKVEDFKYAALEIESLDPAGEVWVNGEPAAVLKGRKPRSIDITEYLTPGEENTIAVRVKPYFSENPMVHTPSDRNLGWFLGRTSLVLVPDRCHITENLIHTSSLNDTEAVQRHKVSIKNETGFSRKGSITINYHPWFPVEGDCVASISKEIEIRPRITNVYDLDMEISAPLVWSTGNPQLYRVEVILKDEEGKPVDDYVTTTGVRVIEQKNGVLYINHKPDMLNGAQNFGYRLPIENISKTVRCGSDEMVMKDLMMAQKLGNLLRIHIHFEMDVVDGVNDPRYAEYADQMGMYLIWQSAGWLREGEVWNVDIENWPLYMKQVYNHPSIILWEASNHPNRFKNHDRNDTEDYFNAIISAIADTDTSRLISPTSFWQHSHYGNYDGTVDYQGNSMEPNPVLMHKMMTRGSQDAYTGYGNDWSHLRNYPYPWAESCLDAKDLCYFNFEHEESAAQPNWELARKEPWYNVQSYEWDYEKGSIGRHLEFDEWRASQAFQAFSAWESMKIQTLSGVCGFSWCSLESGANMFTYQKPLVDPFNVPKLAFYANRMVFQRLWAASNDVDTVYGPSDCVKPVIFNLGDECVADLTIELCNSRGKVIERKVLRNIKVAQGRSVTHLEPFRFKSAREGCHFIVYKITPHKG